MKRSTLSSAQSTPRSSSSRPASGGGNGPPSGGGNRPSGSNRPARPEGDARQRRRVYKHVVAVGFDIFNDRAVLGANNNPAPGEPARGVGALAPPWNANGDRPLAWALTKLGRDVLAGKFQFPGECKNLGGTIPQPAHGRWRNPRPRDIIRIAIDPGIYTMFVDDMDCSTHDVNIIKNVRIFGKSGNIDFVGGGMVQVWGDPEPRPFIDRDVPYLERKGWSLQPGPIIFGGQLIVGDTDPAEITISILKRAADPDADAIITNSDITRILINPDK